MKDRNIIFNSTLENSERFCVHCHVKLVNHNNERYLFKCPSCGVTTSLVNSEPGERLTTTFPTQTDNIPVEINKRFVYQGSEQRLPRNISFQIKRAQEKNRAEYQDPYLKMLRQRSDITITSTEYYSEAAENE